MNYKQEIFSELDITDRQINTYICSLQPLKHNEKDYQSLLKLKQQFNKQELKQKNIFNILYTLPKQINNNPKDIICYCCYLQISDRSKLWCKICGNKVCQKCFKRQRLIHTGQLIKFCQKCDKQYLNAMLQKNYQKQYIKINKSFNRLVQQQQSLENLMKIQKDKTIINGQQKQQNKFILNSQYIKQLKIFKRSKQNQIEEIKNKIKWGKDISINLQRKLKKYKKIHTGDLNSIYDDQSQIQPPKVTTDPKKSIDNINQSVVSSFLRDNQEQIILDKPKFCGCFIY